MKSCACKLAPDRVLARNMVFFFLLSLTYTAACEAQNLDLSGIAHVAFRVVNYEDSRRFYETLGFEQAFEVAEPGRARESFIKINDRQFLELYEKTGDAKPGFMHICFETSEIESLRNAYVKVGLSPTEVRKFRAGNLLFTLRDAGGQLVEYTQYLPGSLHSEDRGKHLGGNRISDRLVESSTPAPNFDAEREYYGSKLGFQPSGGASTVLRLPGTSGQQIEFVSAGAPARIALAVDNLKRTQKSLRQRKIKFEKHDRTIEVTDPNGNMVIFTTPKK